MKAACADEVCARPQLCLIDARVALSLNAKANVNAVLGCCAGQPYWCLTVHARVCCSGMHVYLIWFVATCSFRLEVAHTKKK